MKLLLIKIGKAWNVLRRDGLSRGGERIVRAFVTLFRPVLPGDVLFISNGVGDSARYRTAHVAEELNVHGIRASVTVQDNPFLLSYAKTFSVFIFHRVVYTEKIRALIEILKQEGKTILFETDDLVYDPKYLVLMDYYTQMNTLEKKMYSNGLGGEILADPAVEVATTTTTFLAEKLREKGKTVYIVPNRLSKRDVTRAEEVLEIQKKMSGSDGLIRVGYISGTPSHNKDFATITPVLATLLAKYPALRLVLAGPLDIDTTLEPYTDQIERLPFVSRAELFVNIASLDINLAPLELDNPFCEAKSELKFFEAGIVKVPTVAVANQTFREAITDGIDGYTAGKRKEWTEKIERLITDPELRERIGEGAYKTARLRYTTEHSENEAYYTYLQSRIKKSL